MTASASAPRRSRMSRGAELNHSVSGSARIRHRNRRAARCARTSRSPRIACSGPRRPVSPPARYGRRSAPPAEGVAGVDLNHGVRVDGGIGREADWSDGSPCASRATWRVRMRASGAESTRAARRTRRRKERGGAATFAASSLQQSPASRWASSAASKDAARTRRTMPRKARARRTPVDVGKAEVEIAERAADGDLAEIDVRRRRRCRRAAILASSQSRPPSIFFASGRRAIRASDAPRDEARFRNGRERPLRKCRSPRVHRQHFPAPGAGRRESRVRRHGASRGSRR